MPQARNEVKRKRIVILSRGPIYPKGNAYGPILTPYHEDIQTINALVSGGYDVREVITGGKKVKLTLENVNDENDVVAKEVAAKEAADKAAKALAEEEAAAKAAKEAAEREAREAKQKAEADAKANKKIEDNAKHK